MKKMAALSLLISTHALAMGTFNSFAPNTQISSSAMNANFTLTKTAVDALEATQLGSNLAMYTGSYAFPAIPGAAGQVLTWTGTSMIWQTPVGGGGGLSSLNGQTVPTQTFSVAIAGLIPEFTSAAGMHTLSLPLASVSTNAGLLSNADYVNFNNKLSAPAGMMGQVLTYNGSQWSGADAVTLGGNTMPGNIAVGTMGPYSTSLKTNGMDRLSIDQSGFVNIGGAPTNGAKLSVDSGTMNMIGGSILQGKGTLDSTSGNQSGLFINPIIEHYGSSASYTGIKLKVVENSPGMGPNKLLDLQVGANSMFAVDSKGFIAGPNDWMGSMTATSPNIMCTSTEPTIAQRYQVTGITPDFGTYSNTISVAGVYEILIDTPMVGSGSDFQVNNVLYNGSTTIALQPGRNIKRLPVGTYSFYLGCTSASSVNATITGNMAVLGIRKLH